MKKILLLVLLIVASKGFCQNNGSNHNETQLKSSKIYFNKALWYLKAPQFNYDSAALYFDKTIAILLKNENFQHQKLAEVYFEIAQKMKFANYTTYEKALEKAKYFIHKIPVENRPKLLEYSILMHEVMALPATGNGELMVKAAVLIQDDKTPAIQARLLGDKGMYFSKSNANYNFAYPYLIQSIKIYEKLDHRNYAKEMFEIYNLIIWHYNLKVKYDSCDIIFKKQDALLPLINDPATTVRYLSFKANNFIRRNKDKLALPLLKESELMSEKYNLTLSEGFIFNTNLQGVIAFKEKNYVLAEKFFLKSLKVAEKIKKFKANEGVLQHLAELYEQKGDYYLANKYNKLHEEVVLKIALNNSEKSLREAELQLNVLSKESELSQKTKERNWYVGALAAGLFLLGLVYRNFRLKQKSNKKLAILNKNLANKNILLDKRNAENELLLKEIHHRVKNNLEVVSSLLALQSAQIDHPSTKDAMTEGQNRVNSIGIVHQKLYQGTNLGAVEMKDYFLNLSESILDSFGAEQRIDLQLAMENLDLDIDTAVPLGLIVNELLTNCIKYAFPSGEKGTITIKLHKPNKTILRLEVADNGVGKSGITQGTGFGGQLISLLTQQLNGTMTEESQNGTILIFNFKIKAA